MNRLLGVFFVSGGILFLSVFVYLVWLRYTPTKLAFDGQIVVQNSVNGQATQPMVLEIGDLSIKLPVILVTLDGKNWQASADGVSYITSSAYPGDIGNSIFYGHNWPNLLGNLKKAKKGQIITIYAANEERREFEIIDVVVVSPDQTNVLSPTSDKRLTLYTCTGFLDRQRLVVIALFKES